MAVFFYGVASLLLLAGRSAAQIAPPLIVFGDSTVDTGNNDYINTSIDFRANFLPYGQEFFGKPSGRFSNGRIFVDFICEFLGVPHVSPYLQPDADHSKGVNFGSGGAGVIPEINPGRVIPLGDQLKYFAEFEEAIYEKWGSHQAKKYLSDAIYIISIANNDYLSGYLSNDELRKKYPAQDFVIMIVTKILEALEFLRSNGARKLVVLEVGPLGCVPALRRMHPNHECFGPARDMGEAHNKALRVALRKWESKYSDTSLLVAGLQKFMMDRITDPTDFGFTESEAACCGLGALRGAGHCGRFNPDTNESFEKCENPEDYVFWDFFHASEKMHEEFANALWDGPTSVISPLNVRQLVDLSSTPDCDEDDFAAYSSDSQDTFPHFEHSSI